MSVVWCGVVLYVRHACIFNAIRESVGSTFGVDTGVNVGTCAGIDICILLVSFRTVWDGTVPYGMVLVACTCTVP